MVERSRKTVSERVEAILDPPKSEVVVWGRRRGGPWHRAQDAPYEDLAWCGVRRQYRHDVIARGDRGLIQTHVTCPRCLTAIRKGVPQAWGR